MKRLLFNLEILARYRIVIMVILAVLTGFIFSRSGFTQDKPRPQVTESAVLMIPDNLKWSLCGEPKGCEFALTRADVKDHAEYFFRAPASTKWSKHWHTNASFLVGVRGNLIMSLEGGKELSLGPGAYMYVPAGMIHWARCSDEGPCVVYEYMYNQFDSFNVKE